MLFSTFYGSERTAAALLGAAQSARLPAAVLLYGPAGTGKRTLARLTAAALLCEDDSPALRPCGACRACRKVLADIHPDVITVDRDERPVTVDDARALRTEAFLSPNEGRAKVFLVRRAQNANDAAQNALLRVLEEPPRGVHFLILTENREALLPTIRSRCMELPVAALSPDMLRTFLARRFPDASPQDAETAAAAAQGVPGTAFRLLSSPEDTQEDKDTGTDMTREAAAMLRLLLKNDEYAFAAHTLELERLKRAEFAALLDAASLILRDALALSRGGACAANADARACAQEIARALDSARILYLTRLVLDRRALCDRNVGVPHMLGALAASYFTYSGDPSRPHDGGQPT